MGGVETRPTRQSGRRRTKTVKASELEMGILNDSHDETSDQHEDDGNESENITNEATIVVNTPRTRHSTEDRQRQMAPTKEKPRKEGNTGPVINLQIKVLTDLVTSLLKTSEEQKQSQAKLIGALT